MKTIPVATNYNLRSCILGNTFIFLLALIFRSFITISEGFGINHAAQIIHGSTADLLFPFAAMALAAYFDKQSLYRGALLICHLYVILIATDIFNFVRFGDRISHDLLLENSLLNWLRHDRFIFLAILLASWLIFMMIKWLSTSNNRPVSKNKKFMLLLCSLMLFMAQTPKFSTEYSINKSSWESLYKSYSFNKRSNLQRSSLNCLFHLYICDQTVLRSYLFCQTHFSRLYFENFTKSAESAKAIINDLKMPKVWLHRGYHNSTIPQNSIAAFEKAINSGFYGIEIDIHYLTESDKIVVCHDLPEKQKDYQSLPELEAYLETASKHSDKRIQIWLDFKNLNYDNQQAALKKLSLISEKHQAKNLILIESNNAFILHNFSNAGFKTIWGLYYGLSTAQVKTEDLPIIKAYAALSGCAIISLPWEVADSDAQEKLSPMPLAVYTVNSPKQIANFKALPQTCIILTDLNTPSAE